VVVLVALVKEAAIALVVLAALAKAVMIVLVVLVALAKEAMVALAKEAAIVLVAPALVLATRSSPRSSDPETMKALNSTPRPSLPCRWDLPPSRLTKPLGFNP